LLGLESPNTFIIGVCLWVNIMTLKVYVVDNGGQWTHREWRVLRDIGADCKIIPNTTPFEEIDVDGLVLSGGAPR
jgi:GMP synthase-like glutamine amidotransferase